MNPAEFQGFFSIRLYTIDVLIQSANCDSTYKAEGSFETEFFHHCAVNECQCVGVLTKVKVKVRRLKLQLNKVCCVISVDFQDQRAEMRPADGHRRRSSLQERNCRTDVPRRGH